MKKIIMMVLVLCMGLGLVGCNKNDLFGMEILDRRIIKTEYGKYEQIILKNAEALNIEEDHVLKFVNDSSLMKKDCYEINVMPPSFVPDKEKGYDDVEYVRGAAEFTVEIFKTDNRLSYSGYSMLNGKTNERFSNVIDLR